MDYRHVTLQAIRDYESQLKRALNGLGEEEARWQASPNANHILWILWHMGRMEDMWGLYLRGAGEQAWSSGGWCERFGMAPERNGVGDTIEQVVNFPDATVAEVTEYWQEQLPWIL